MFYKRIKKLKIFKSILYRYILVILRNKIHLISTRLKKHVSTTQLKKFLPLRFVT